MNWQGALAGIIVGGITTFVWYYLVTPIFPLYEMVPGVILSLIAIFVVTKLTSEPDKEVQDTFDAYKAEIGTKRT